jgi:hypothetical protein
MPLRDHFRGWLYRGVQWRAFHNSWATFIAASINDNLPEGFRALANVQTSIETDVAAFGDKQYPAPNAPDEGWQPAGGPPSASLEVSMEDYYDQWIFFDDRWAAHPTLAAGILTFAARWDVLT